MEESLRKKRELVLVLKERLDETEKELSLVRKLLKEEVIKNKKLFIELNKLETTKSGKEKEYKELLNLFKKQMLVMDKLKEQLKGEKGRINVLIKDSLLKEKEIGGKKRLIFKLKKELFLANKVLHEGFEGDEFLKEISEEINVEPKSILDGDVDTKKMLYLLKSLKKELVEKEEKIIRRNKELRLGEKDTLELENEAESFKKRVDSVEAANKNLLRENFELSNNVEFLKRAVDALKGKNERLDLAYGKNIEKLKQEYEEKIKGLMKEKVEEDVRIRVSSLREEPLDKKESKEATQTEEKTKDNLMKKIEKNSKHIGITTAKKGPMKRIISRKEKSLFGGTTTVYAPKHEELVPLIKIALEHGESKEKVKESLINSGHEISLVEKALSKF
ncbi:hypothetical protein H8D83_00585 [Candidatus Woesearchaeota archaeon]|nr:hypothetical protein [Candidatus Woesearchaeota archaeon]